jgi:hypothetical protein
VRKSGLSPVFWWIGMIGSGLLPLAPIAFSESPWTNSNLETYLVVVSLYWCLRIVSLYKLLGPRANEYEELVTRRWGWGGGFAVFLSSVFLIISTFATLYWGLSGRAATAFTEPLTGVDAIYFATTVFTTTGFGDVAPLSESARLAVTLQTLFGFAFVVGAIGFALSRAGRRGQRDNG